MTPLSENALEDYAIGLFKDAGFTPVYGPDIAPDSATRERSRYDEVLLINRLERALTRINPTLPLTSIATALKIVQRVSSPNLLENNEAFHYLLTDGVNVSVHQDGAERGHLVALIDFDQPDNNEFTIVNQFTVIENQQKKRPDLIVFVNGIPLVVIELKSPTHENATLARAYQQLETYKQAIPRLFISNAFLVIADGLEAKAGSLSSGFSRFMAWKTADGKTEASPLVSPLETLIKGMLNKATLLDMLRHFIVFEKSTKEDAKTGLIRINTVKKIAAYHQYYAVNAAVASTLRAVDLDSPDNLHENPAQYHLPSVIQQPRGDKKAGVVWHTQGSGKSLSMVFYTGKIVLALNNPTILVITDRNDLDDQLFDTFASSSQLLRQKPVQANTREALKALLRVGSGGVVFSTIQKFQPPAGNIFETLSDRRNIVVIADEAHRTQYGFGGKIMNDTDASGEIIGQRLVYGFAKYLRDALPNATYLGFTGTPIEKTDVNTPAVFGHYVDIYDIAQAVEDGATVRIYYESRLAKIGLSEEGRQMIAELDSQISQSDETAPMQKAKSKWARIEALVGSRERLQNLANDIVAHFSARQAVFTGKGMIVCMSRSIAVALYNEIIALKPEWHSDDLNQGVIKVVMTAASSDGPELAKHHTTKHQRKTLADRMKDHHDPLQLVIVRDMWLTGFDAPSTHTLYIDKPMKGHNLMQAIARVNRVFNDKPAGLVVDYLGIASDLKEALSFYAEAGGQGDPTLAQDQAVQLMLEKLEVVRQFFHGFAYADYFSAGTGQKLSIILSAEEHLLTRDSTGNPCKKRYMDHVMALSKAFAIAVPHEQALAIKDEVAFFQAIRVRLSKFDSSETGLNDVDLETTLKQIIDKALVSEQVVDIFDSAGIKKPDISILSDEFLAELKDHQHQNVALALLKKLLNDELRSRAKRNLVQSQSMLQMLETAINKYQNKVLTAAEVIDELINISKDMVASDNTAKQMGLTDYEYAFYTAVASNDSAQAILAHDTLRELAVVLTQRVKENASIDWTIKENVRSKLKVIIKRTLRQYGYPPDMALLATETVLRQAEMIAEALTA